MKKIVYHFRDVRSRKRMVSFVVARVMLRNIFISILIFCFSSVIYADNSFVIKNIKINGLQGLSKSTVLDYLPSRVGSRVNEEQTDKIIDALYETGFFSSVKLYRRGNGLVIYVDQRPVISQLTLSGNKMIPSDKLKHVLAQQGLEAGKIFNKSTLTMVKTALEREIYIPAGRYNARVDVDVIKQPRNRVGININISEGLPCKIKQIKIIGCHAFSEEELLKQFSLSTPGLFSCFTDNDEFSQQKLDADLEKLNSYYLDRGYVKFHVDSSQVALTPDRKHVYITVHVTEGDQYKLGGYSLSGRLILSKAQLRKVIDLNTGELFSRKKIQLTNHRIVSALSDKGYANTNIQVLPRFDESKKEVSLTFKIIPGNKVYIRHINFTGNYHTNDDVLRRALLQFEGSLYSSKKVEMSKSKILTLPSQSISDVKISTSPVVAKQNQLDLNYSFSEKSSANIQGGVSYSQLDKFMVNAAVTQNNVFGTGSSLTVGAQKSSSTISGNFSYYNPYYTASGIGRSISVYGSRVDAAKQDISDYTLSLYGAKMTYVFPVTYKSTISVGGGIEGNIIGVENNPSLEVLKFTEDHGRHFTQVDMNTGWDYEGFDRNFFPTRGFRNAINLDVTLPVGKKSLEYYLLNYSASYYHPIYKGFIGNLSTTIGYGNGYGKFSGDLPFFRNFHAGGMNSDNVVRGYDDNSLGPRDSNGQSLGGNFGVGATAALVLPSILTDNIRTELFVDAGNVYKGVDFRDMRFSSGLDIQWLTPIGAVFAFSLAEPLNKKLGDQTSVFQFTIGAQF